MNTIELVAESKARFNHNAAKEYLKEKYESKLILADQGGLWKADTQTISFLYRHTTETSDPVVLLDMFDNPVEVNAITLYNNLRETYNSVMQQWHNEWKELESKR